MGDLHRDQVLVDKKFDYEEWDPRIDTWRHAPILVRENRAESQPLKLEAAYTSRWSGTNKILEFERSSYSFTKNLHS
jgi:hypothetical protein